MLANRQTDTHTHTDRQFDHNTPQPYRGGVKLMLDVFPWSNKKSSYRQFDD